VIPAERLRLRRADVPLVEGLRAEEGWVQMQVQFLLSQANTGRDDFLLGWTVLPPGGLRRGERRHVSI
jgi:hypothetical protein